MTRSKEWFGQGASLSQKLADTEKDYVQLAGADPKISKKIQRIKVMIRHNIIKDSPDIKLILDILNGDRLAVFATSDHLNEISKMGLQMPKSDAVYFDE